MKAIKISLLSVCVLFIAACMAVNHTCPVRLSKSARIGVVSFLNNSETPAAGISASDIAANILRVKGSLAIVNYPLNQKSKIVLPGVQYRISKAEIQRFVYRNHLDYVLIGTVTEWGYKAGIDGEPAVGFTLQLVDTRTQQIVWSGVAGRTGNSRESVAIIAQQLLRKTFENIKFNLAW